MTWVKVNVESRTGGAGSPQTAAADSENLKLEAKRKPIGLRRVGWVGGRSMICLPEEELSEGSRPLFLCGWQLVLHKGSVVRPPGVNRGNNVCGKVEGGDQLLDRVELFGKVKLGQVDGHPGGVEEFYEEIESHLSPSDGKKVSLASNHWRR